MLDQKEIRAHRLASPSTDLRHHRLDRLGKDLADLVGFAFA
jgi:hypothetical protein